MPIRPIKDILQTEMPAIHVVDVGAMPEYEDRYTGLVRQGLARVTGFEPNPEQFQRLAVRQGPYRYLPYFLGDGGLATFHVTRYPGCSSLYEPDPAVIDLFTSIGAGDDGNFSVISTQAVETRRLDDISELGHADFIKLDVQGAELDILRHGTVTLDGALVVECEVEFLALYKRQPLFGDVYAFLAAHGFVLHKLIDVQGRCLRPFVLNNNPYAPISQMLWADAVFVRDFTRLERFANEELLNAAVILHEVYFSYDLAVHFLKEYDRRAGADLAGSYAAKVFTQGDLPTLYLNLKLGV
ncbi:MAG TPA: FkbM family methyltransferase [Gemmataceae bacterium]|jgi:FkbM family methyltransferase|nr:FkbM family methyltransferase [Gemmataceae bacterium]